MDHGYEVIDARKGTTFSRKPGHMLFTLDADIPGVGVRGQQILMAVTPADVSSEYQDLDTYLGGYQPFGYTADMVSKIVLVDKETGTRRDFSKENAFEEVNVKVGRMGQINEIAHKSETGTYKTDEYALATFIPYSSEVEAFDLYNVRVASGEMLMWKLSLSREVRVWDSLTTTANWNSNNYTTLTTNYKWDTGSTKNPRNDLHNRIKASAQPVTGIFMNPDVGYWFLSDTEVRAYMKQMLGDGAPSPDVAASADTQGVQSFVIPGYPPFYLCPAKKLSSGTLTYILGDDVVLSCAPPGVPRDGSRIATCYTFRTKGRSGTGITTNEYVPMDRGLEKGTMFETGYKEEHVIVSNIAGGLIKDVLA